MDHITVVEREQLLCVHYPFFSPYCNFHLFTTSLLFLLPLLLHTSLLHSSCFLYCSHLSSIVSIPSSSSLSLLFNSAKRKQITTLFQSENATAVVPNRMKGKVRLKTSTSHCFCCSVSLSLPLHPFLPSRHAYALSAFYLDIHSSPHLAFVIQDGFQSLCHSAPFLPLIFICHILMTPHCAFIFAISALTVNLTSFLHNLSLFPSFCPSYLPLSLVTATEAVERKR